MMIRFMVSAITGVEAILITWRRRRVRRGRIEVRRAAGRRAPRNANRLPPPFAAEHALLECRGVLIVTAGAALAVAEIEVGLKDRIAARLSVGAHQIAIRVVGMVGLRAERGAEQQRGRDEDAFHCTILSGCILTVCRRHTWARSKAYEELMRRRGAGPPCQSGTAFRHR
jgi:hypothetical protein